MSAPLPLLHLSSIDMRPGERMGPYEIQPLIAEHEEGRVTAYRVRIRANRTTSVSYHLVAEELYYVVSGCGIAVLDGVEHELRVGDFLRLPPGTRHGFRTVDEDLVMLDIHCPGSRPNRDVYFEGDVPEGFGGA